jgi:hypothetical protein
MHIYIFQRKWLSRRAVSNIFEFIAVDSKVLICDRGHEYIHRRH